MDGARGLGGGAVVTLVNFAEDPTSRQRARPIGDPQPLVLILTVLLSFDLPRYQDSLRHLGTVITLFQEKPVYTPNDASSTHPFSAGLQQLLLTREDMGAETLADLWRILGVPHVPSVVYQVRLIH